MMVLMVTKHRKSMLQVKIRIKEKQHKIYIGFVLLVANDFLVALSGDSRSLQPYMVARSTILLVGSN